jgi:predicted dehydrogenase
MAKVLRAVIIGCGNRGQMFGELCRQHPELARVAAVVEPREDWRAAEGKKNNLPPGQQFAGFEEALAAGAAQADVALVACNDRNHFGATMAALGAGLDVLLEKPVAHETALVVRLALEAKRTGRRVAVQHELRYSPFFQEVRHVVQSGTLGQVYSYTHTEHVDFWHMAHSFVRGNWGSTATSAPMILAKCCHDLDLMPWILGDEVERVASFGRLDHFRPENRPPGAPERCTDGCPVGDTCIYNAEKFYLGEKTKWPMAVLGLDTSVEGRRRALVEGPYGRCVYGGYNDVVDHQTVLLETARGTLATLTMQGFSPHEEGGRKLRLDGTKGTLRGDMERGLIHVWRHWSGPYGTRVEPEVIDLSKSGLDGHGGGDERLFTDVMKIFAAGAGQPLTPIEDSVESHLLAFAAEESRLTGKVVKMVGYRRKAKREAKAVASSAKR